MFVVENFDFLGVKATINQTRQQTKYCLGLASQSSKKGNNHNNNNNKFLFFFIFFLHHTREGEVRFELVNSIRFIKRCPQLIELSLRDNNNNNYY